MSDTIILSLGGEQAIIIRKHPFNCASHRRWPMVGVRFRCSCGLEREVVATSDEHEIRTAAREIFAQPQGADHD